jgi:hypothetical protein
VSSSSASRRAEALALAEELLGDIEFSRISPSDIARRASRLARLLDDTEATAWLACEVGGFPEEPAGTLPPEVFEAARRSNRVFRDGKGQERANTSPLGQIEATIDASSAQIAAASDKPVSLTTPNLPAINKAIEGNRAERGVLRNLISNQRGLLEKVLGAMHGYVAGRYQELRFGSAVESAFEVVRAEVDGQLAELVPDALPKLSAAFENATSDNPEDWASGAATCRRLLKAAANALRPPGPVVDGREMGAANYINRLVDWIVNQAESETRAEMIRADLEYLGRRLDAANDAGHKGAHAEVSRLDASRFVAGTYLLLGDVLSLRAGTETTPHATHGASAAEGSPVVPAA